MLHTLHRLQHRFLRVFGMPDHADHRPPEALHAHPPVSHHHRMTGAHQGPRNLRQPRVLVGWQRGIDGFLTRRIARLRGTGRPRA
jgi:hypothetical protein